MKDCLPVLEKFRYACFSKPSHSLNEVKKPKIPDIKQRDLNNVFVVELQVGRLVAESIADMVRLMHTP